jgi:protocatechuate 3,4-dioxygenase beta subunit
MHNNHNHDLEPHDLGLAADVNMLTRTIVDRRKALALGLAGITALRGCNITTSTSSGACSPIPPETAGPYPADGSVASGQSLNVLTRSGVVRSDIRPSLGTSTVAGGVLLSVKLKLVNTNASCAALSGYAVYLWHCNQTGGYSMYSSGITAEDYLRGVQVSDANGEVSFTTVFPGCYDGRYPHIHFEIYPSLASATSASNKIQTSQLALPAAACNAVYGTSGYGQSTNNFAKTSLASDNIFSDGSSLQVASVTGDTTSGFAASLTVGLAR